MIVKIIKRLFSREYEVELDIIPKLNKGDVLVMKVSNVDMWNSEYLDSTSKTLRKFFGYSPKILIMDKNMSYEVYKDEIQQPKLPVDRTYPEIG